MHNRVSLLGISPEFSFGGDRTLTTHLMAIELSVYFLLLPENAKTEGLLKSVHSKLNKVRIEEISESVKAAVYGRKKGPFLSLTYVVGGKPTLNPKRHDLGELCYDSRNTMIVDGILEWVAIAKLLGIEHPFTPSRRSSFECVLADSETQQLLSQLPIQITLIFNTSSGLNFDDMCNYYALYNARTSQLHSPIQSSMMYENKITSYINEISREIKLNDYGGMMHSSMRLTKSEQGIVAEATLIKLVLGAIAGPNAQDKNKVEHFNQRKGAFTDNAIDEAKSHIVSFLTVWLKGISNQLNNDRDGLHYSPSLWLSLGLLIREIITSNPSTKIEGEIARSAHILSRLDYSKSATHWSKCRVMELDSSGKKYKNSTGGGRSFRVGIVNYLLSYISPEKADIK